MKKSCGLLCLFLFSLWRSALACPVLSSTQQVYGCSNGANIYLLNYVTLDGIHPSFSKGYFTILAYNNSRTDPRVKNTQFYNQNYFKATAGAGDWLIKYTYTADLQCPLQDSFHVIINSPPTLSLVGLSYHYICDGQTLNLNQKIDKNASFPQNGSIYWVGLDVQSDSIYSAKNYSANGLYTTILKAIIVDPLTACRDTAPLTMYVYGKPEVSITGGDSLALCQRGLLTLQATTKWVNNGVKWLTANGTSGNFMSTSQSFALFQCSPSDSIRGWAKVIIRGESNAVCPPAFDSVFIKFKRYPTLMLSPKSENFCVDAPINMNAAEISGMPYSNLSWYWAVDFKFNSNTNQLKPVTFSGAGIHDLLVYSANIQEGCTTTIQKKLLINNKPSASFEPSHNSVLFIDPTIHFTNFSALSDEFAGQNLQFIWNFGDPNITDDTSREFEPNWTFSHVPGVFLVKLVAVSDWGCRDSATRNITVHGLQSPEKIPNIFSPDANNLTMPNIFHPGIFEAEKFDMKIYNGAGKLVYETSDCQRGWDGSGAEAAAYFYRITYTLKGAEEKKISGPVLLIR